MAQEIYMDDRFLTKEHELELGTKIQNMLALKRAEKRKKVLNDAQKVEIQEGEYALEELLSNHIGMVWDQAKKLKAKYPRSLPLEDLVSEGKTGLMRAALKYDPSRGNRFSTVAFYWVDQAMIRESNKTARMVRLPENRITDLTKINRILQDNEDHPDQVELIHQKTGLKKKDIHNILAAGKEHASLNKQVNSDEGSKELIDFIGDKNPVPAPESSLMKSIAYSVLMEEIDTLDIVSREVLKSSFNLFEDKSTPGEVRRKFKITKEEYSSLLVKGLETVKTRLNENDIELGDFLSEV